MATILIAVPTFESIFPDTFKAIYDLDVSGHDVSFEYVRGYDCATARNRIAKKALNLSVDYVLMVDNDVVLPKDALINLLDDPKPVCLGFYAHRDNDNVYRGIRIDNITIDNPPACPEPVMSEQVSDITAHGAEKFVMQHFTVFRIILVVVKFGLALRTVYFTTQYILGIFDKN